MHCWEAGKGFLLHPFTSVVVSHHSDHCSPECQTLSPYGLLASLSKSWSRFHVLDGSRHRLECLIPFSSAKGLAGLGIQFPPLLVHSLSKFGYLVLFRFSFTIVAQIWSLFPLDPSLTLCAFVFTLVLQQPLNWSPYPFASINQYSLMPKGPFQNANRVMLLPAILKRLFQWKFMLWIKC